MDKTLFSNYGGVTNGTVKGAGYSTLEAMAKPADAVQGEISSEMEDLRLAILRLSDRIGMLGMALEPVSVKLGEGAGQQHDLGRPPYAVRNSPLGKLLQDRTHEIDEAVKALASLTSRVCL